jgi:Kef-type K+ transport system membrane component KefB
MGVVEHLRSGIELLPALAKFGIGMVLIIVIPKLAQLINLPGIVGSFLAGLALNAAVKDKPAKSKLHFMSNTLFIPCFFVVTGFLIDPLALARSLTGDFVVAGGLIGALFVGKWIAAEAAGRAFGYAPAARKTMWSLTLPQLAATLAATLVATKTVNATGQPLIDGRILNSVLVMVLITAVVGPVLTQRYALRMLGSGTAAGDVPI